MMLRALTAAVPFHAPLDQGLRESYRGVVNYRIKSATFEHEWMVDVYNGGNYFVVTARNWTQVCSSVPSAIGHLRRMLGLK